MGGVVRYEVITMQPSGLLSTIQSYQTLISAVIALVAATVAYVNISRQLTAQKSAETRQKRSRRQQMASALAGEIRGILYLFGNDVRRMKPYYLEYASKVEDADRPENWWPMAVSGDYMIIYKTISGELGNLPGDLPERIAKFYVELRGVFDRISAAETGIYNQGSGKDAAFMARVLVGEIARAEETGTALVKDLEASQSAS